METVSATSPAVQAFQISYLSELDQRVQRGEVVGTRATERDSAALFYDAQDQKFVLVETLTDVAQANVFDCIPREQWGRTVMLFGHATDTGGFIASGHGTLNGNTLHAKLATGRSYRIPVDATRVPLQPYVQALPEKKAALDVPGRNGRGRTPRVRDGGKNRAVAGTAERSPAPQVERQHPDEESEDFTAEDLARLRGEVPLAGKSKKKWRK